MIKKLLFRMLRKEMVARMFAMKFTWNKINTVLIAFGQDIVVSYENQKDKGGIMIQFGKVDAAKLRKDTLTQRALNRKTNKK